MHQILVYDLNANLTKFQSCWTKAQLTHLQTQGGHAGSLPQRKALEEKNKCIYSEKDRRYGLTIITLDEKQKH